MDFKFCYHPPCAAGRLSNSQSKRKITFITESGLNAFGMAIPHPLLARLLVNLDDHSCTSGVGKQRRFVKFWPHEKKPQSQWDILFVDDNWRRYCPWTDDLVWSWGINGPDNFSEMHGYSMGFVFTDGIDGVCFGLNSKNFMEQCWSKKLSDLLVQESKRHVRRDRVGTAIIHKDRRIHPVYLTIIK